MQVRGEGQGATGHLSTAGGVGEEGFGGRLQMEGGGRQGNLQ